MMDHPKLTAKEQAVVDLVTGCRSLHHMARTLGISQSAIKNRLINIYKKYGVRTRIELVAFLLTDKRPTKSEPIEVLTPVKISSSPPPAVESCDLILGAQSPLPDFPKNN
jgi:DNA-binding CsgD family transcriptional regulator